MNYYMLRLGGLYIMGVEGFRLGFPLLSTFAVDDHTFTMDPATDVTTVSPGALYLGSTIPWGLFGVLSMQVYVYFQGGHKDPIKLKFLVYGVYITQLAQLAMYVHVGFSIFGPGFGNWAGTNRVGTIWFSACVLDGIVTFVVQVFYAWRIYSLSRGKKTVTILIAISSAVSAGACIAVGVRLEQSGRLNRIYDNDVVTLAEIWVITSAFCDILIASCMTYYLKRQLRGVVYRDTVALINHIVRLTIETGTFTASLSIATLIGCSIKSVVVYQITLLACFSGIYSTTLMTVLNSRLKVVNSSTWQDSQPDIELGTIEFHLPPTMVTVTAGDMQSVTSEEQIQPDLASTSVNTGKEEDRKF